ncbi:junctional adhesion molecule-like isoform X2 [Myxocyprinus asiaticus]|uniref:junctional adhesion molecule-like isoform X2 n=1 Tax=Myxocyprinus asiaticus TaxID=70543 RepID=UPI00222357F1|nr:junctional adhesion molecule-like isoform X2 [Myxocyprinus asiaticus]
MFWFRPSFYLFMKMGILYCIFMSLLIITDGFVVKGPTDPLMVPLGGSVVLPCYVDTPLPMENLEVEWRRSDSDTPVHLYQDGESKPEVQQQDYHDRAHFFTDQIQHGNFSILLNNVRVEDEGTYRCKVFSNQDSDETLVQIKDIERLIVSGSRLSVSVYAGDDVTLNCSVDSHITPEEVSWKKTDKDEDGDLLVLLYQSNETLPESSHEQYMDRVEFFTDEIPKGNFSLRLKSVRTEDKGVYMCQVFAGDFSANTTVVLEDLGFSTLHIMVLILCIAASGSALLLCCLIYWQSKKTETNRTVWTLQVSLVFCPNIFMFFAFIVWGVTEGFLNETVPCCALYILRPVMLLWALPFLNYLQDDIKTWIRFSRIGREFAVLTIVVYSVLFAYTWKKIAHYTKHFDLAYFLHYVGELCYFCVSLSSVEVLEAKHKK